MCISNPTWGAPRVHGELLKLGIDISQSTVSKYVVRPRKPSSQTWRTSLKNHVKQLVSVDFFVVPTIDFKLLFVYDRNSMRTASSTLEAMAQLSRGVRLSRVFAAHAMKLLSATLILFSSSVLGQTSRGQ